MIPTERIMRIQELLNKHKNMSTKDLANTLYVSESTIRRDLQELEQTGVLRRYHGGASIVKSTATEFSSRIRELENRNLKTEICNKAAPFISNDMMLFIDSSSTCLHLIPHLINFHHLVILTNSIQLAAELRSYDNLDIFITGGKLKKDSISILGNLSQQMINHFKADIFLFSCKFFDEDYIYEADMEQTTIKQQFLKNAKQSILLADTTKFQKQSFIKLEALKKIDYIVTDSHIKKSKEHFSDQWIY